MFLCSLVIEKEMKIVENMKINGMKMSNYWLVNFLFFFMIYLLSAFLYWIAGRFVFDLSFFSKTD
jgi:hypothetical protein